MKTIFFTICDSKFQQGGANARNLDFAGFRNSFKRTHPDVELRVFDERDMAARGLNFYNAKAAFGLELKVAGYDLVVNVDADHYFFERCDEILSADYDVACPANFNITDNLVGIRVSSGINGQGNAQDLVSVIDFLQGGLVASPSLQFWTHYAWAVERYYKRFVCFENDVLNLVAHLYPYRVKVLDGAYDYRSGAHRCWYGCSLLGKEQTCYVEGRRLMCDGKPVKVYHFAHGGGKRPYREVFGAGVHGFIASAIAGLGA